MGGGLRTPTTNSDIHNTHKEMTYTHIQTHTNTQIQRYVLKKSVINIHDENMGS